MSTLSAFAAGLVFGLGLILAGMTDPGKVLAFLDVSGAWDPSLAFVMVGAILVAAGAFAAAKRRTRALLGGAMQLPRREHVDRRLVLGSVVFGVGWGLGGFCPGPGIVAAGAGEAQGLVFLVAMVAGMGVHAIARRRGRNPED